jgi:hypothetical protein
MHRVITGPTVQMLFVVAIVTANPCSVASSDERQAAKAIRDAGGMYNIDDDQPTKPVIEVLLQDPKFTDEVCSAPVGR